MRDEDYPALYQSADSASAAHQRSYLSALGASYTLLVVEAGLGTNPVNTSWYYIVFFSVLALSAAAVLYLVVKKPEQDWYQARAVAESVKTMTWRFMMKAEPFDTDDAAATAELRAFYRQLIQRTNIIGRAFSDADSSGPQVTDRMRTVRAMQLAHRIELYDSARVQNQRTWYARKSALNRRSSTRWSIAIFVFYALALLLGVLQVAYRDAAFLPTQAVVVLAASALGWMQAKRFAELSSSYKLTAHEIGVVHSALREVRLEADFASFVSEAERAFSREHTQWIARRD